MSENQQDDTVITFPETPAKECLVGPFEEYRVVVEGRMIPRLTGFKEGDKTWLVVDRRFAYGIPHEHAYGVASLVAQALAIGSGYPWLGAESREMPFAPHLHEIEGVP